MGAANPTVQQGGLNWTLGNSESPVTNTETNSSGGSGSLGELLNSMQAFENAMNNGGNVDFSNALILENYVRDQDNSSNPVEVTAENRSFAQGIVGNVKKDRAGLASGKFEKNKLIESDAEAHDITRNRLFTGASRIFKSILGTGRIISKVEESGAGKYQVIKRQKGKDENWFKYQLDNALGIVREFTGIYTDQDFVFNQDKSAEELFTIIHKNGLTISPALQEKLRVEYNRPGVQKNEKIAKVLDTLQNGNWLERQALRAERVQKSGVLLDGTMLGIRVASIMSPFVPGLNADTGNIINQLMNPRFLGLTLTPTIQLTRTYAEYAEKYDHAQAMQMLALAVPGMAVTGFVSYFLAQDFAHGMVENLMPALQHMPSEDIAKGVATLASWATAFGVRTFSSAYVMPTMNKSILKGWDNLTGTKRSDEEVADIVKGVTKIASTASMAIGAGQYALKHNYFDFDQSENLETNFSEPLDLRSLENYQTHDINNLSPEAQANFNADITNLNSLPIPLSENGEQIEPIEYLLSRGVDGYRVDEVTGHLQFFYNAGPNNYPLFFEPDEIQIGEDGLMNINLQYTVDGQLPVGITDPSQLSGIPVLEITGDNGEGIQVNYVLAQTGEFNSFGDTTIHINDDKATWPVDQQQYAEVLGSSNGAAVITANGADIYITSSATPETLREEILHTTGILSESDSNETIVNFQNELSTGRGIYNSAALVDEVRFQTGEAELNYRDLDSVPYTAYAGGGIKDTITVGEVNYTILPVNAAEGEPTRIFYSNDGGTTIYELVSDRGHYYLVNLDNGMGTINTSIEIVQSDFINPGAGGSIEHPVLLPFDYNGDSTPDTVTFGSRNDVVVWGTQDGSHYYIFDASGGGEHELHILYKDGNGAILSYEVDGQTFSRSNVNAPFLLGIPSTNNDNPPINNGNYPSTGNNETPSTGSQNPNPEPAQNEEEVPIVMAQNNINQGQQNTISSNPQELIAGGPNSDVRSYRDSNGNVYYYEENLEAGDSIRSQSGLSVNDNIHILYDEQGRAVGLVRDNVYGTNNNYSQGPWLDPNAPPERFFSTIAQGGFQPGTNYIQVATYAYGSDFDNQTFGTWQVEVNAAGDITRILDDRGNVVFSGTFDIPAAPIPAKLNSDLLQPVNITTVSNNLGIRNDGNVGTTNEYANNLRTDPELSTQIGGLTAEEQVIWSRENNDLVYYTGTQINNFVNFELREVADDYKFLIDLGVLRPDQINSFSAQEYTQWMIVAREWGFFTDNATAPFNTWLLTHPNGTFAEFLADPAIIQQYGFQPNEMGRGIFSDYIMYDANNPGIKEFEAWLASRPANDAYANALRAYWNDITADNTITFEEAVRMTTIESLDPTFVYNVIEGHGIINIGSGGGDNIFGPQTVEDITNPSWWDEVRDKAIELFNPLLCLGVPAALAGIVGLAYWLKKRGVATPAASAPAASVPAASAPAASAPAASAPAASVPAASVPAASVPTASAPAASAPAASVPAASAPAASAPAASVPAASAPAASVPAASVPAASVPAASVPAASVPAASVPAASVPPASAPPVLPGGLNQILTPNGQLLYQDPNTGTLFTPVTPPTRQGILRGILGRTLSERLINDVNYDDDTLLGEINNLTDGEIRAVNRLQEILDEREELLRDRTQDEFINEITDGTATPEEIATLRRLYNVALTAALDPDGTNRKINEFTRGAIRLLSGFVDDNDLDEKESKEESIGNRHSFSVGSDRVEIDNDLYNILTERDDRVQIVNQAQRAYRKAYKDARGRNVDEANAREEARQTSRNYIIRRINSSNSSTTSLGIPVKDLFRENEPDEVDPIPEENATVQPLAELTVGQLNLLRNDQDKLNRYRQLVQMARNRNLNEAEIEEYNSIVNQVNNFQNNLTDISDGELNLLKMGDASEGVTYERLKERAERGELTETERQELNRLVGKARTLNQNVKKSSNPVPVPVTKSTQVQNQTRLSSYERQNQQFINNLNNETLPQNPNIRDVYEVDIKGVGKRQMTLRRLGNNNVWHMRNAQTGEWEPTGIVANNVVQTINLGESETGNIQEEFNQIIDVIRDNIGQLNSEEYRRYVELETKSEKTEEDLAELNQLRSDVTNRRNTERANRRSSEDLRKLALEKRQLRRGNGYLLNENVGVNTLNIALAEEIVENNAILQNNNVAELSTEELQTFYNYMPQTYRDRNDIDEFRKDLRLAKLVREGKEIDRIVEERKTANQNS